jgi:hypothetical protein
MSFSDLTEQLGPLVEVPTTPTSPAFAIERDLVNNGSVRRWLASTGRVCAGFRDGDDDDDAVGLGPDDAAAYAAFHGLRLPSEQEWAIAAAGAVHGYGLSDLGVRRLCRVWEWTSTPTSRGFVVRGGVPRNDADAVARVEHRSWEDCGAVDVGFRCAVSR